MQPDKIKNIFDATLGKLGFSVEVAEPTIPFRKARFWDLKISSPSTEGLKECVIGIHKNQSYISDFSATFMLPKQESFKLGMSLDVKGAEIDLPTDELLVGIVWNKADNSSVSANLHFEGVLIEDFVIDQIKFLSKLEDHRHFILRIPTVLDSFDASAEDRKQLIDFAAHYSKLMQNMFDAFGPLVKNLQGDNPTETYTTNA